MSKVQEIEDRRRLVYSSKLSEAENCCQSRASRSAYEANCRKEYLSRRAVHNRDGHAHLKDDDDEFDNSRVPRERIARSI